MLISLFTRRAGVWLNWRSESKRLWVSPCYCHEGSMPTIWYCDNLLDLEIICRPCGVEVGYQVGCCSLGGHEDRHGGVSNLPMPLPNRSNGSFPLSDHVGTGRAPATLLPLREASICTLREVLRTQRLALEGARKSGATSRVYRLQVATSNNQLLSGQQAALGNIKQPVSWLLWWFMVDSCC